MAEWVMHHTRDWFYTIEADSEKEAWEKVQAFQCSGAPDREGGETTGVSDMREDAS